MPPGPYLGISPFFKKVLIKSIIIAVILTFRGICYAGLQDQLDTVFGDLTNATSPSLYKGQRRGALVGGTFYARSRIMQPDLINFTPPGWRAGCGGIDLFGGSFSFINMDQFIQLLRAIGQNAAGYAFQIALNSICGDCLEALSDLQKKVQEFNQYFGNSCQMATSLVDKTAGPYIQAVGERIHNILTFKGIADDSFDARTKEDPAKRLSTSGTAEEKKYIKGNMIWRTLKKGSVDTWFGSSDTALLESIMSMTGTVIVQEATKVSDEEGYSYKIVHLGKIIKINDLLRGGDVDVWKCDTTDQDGCLNPTKGNITLKGLDEKVQKLLEDLISSFDNNSTFSNKTKNFLENSFGIGGMIRNLYRSNPQVAKLFASRIAPILSSEMVYVIAADMIRAARTSLRNTEHPQAGEAMQLLNDAWEEISDEYQTIIAIRGNINDIYKFYTNLSAALQPKEFDHRVGIPSLTAN